MHEWRLKVHWDGVAKDDENYLGDGIFKVEAVRRERGKGSGKRYLLKWEGYPRCAI